MRLLLVTLASFAVSFVILFGLRLFGLSQDHLQRKHNFLEQGPALFSVLGDISIADYPSLNNMIETKKRVPNLAWLIPVYIEHDALVAKVDNKSIPLQEILSTFPNDFYFFHIMENKENINYLLNETIKKFSLEDRILLFSPFRNVLTQFRTLRPKWLTALSTTEANLFLLSHKVWLETIAPFPADFMWLDKNDGIWLRDLKTDEIDRRKKFLFCDESLKFAQCKAYSTDSPTTYSADQTSR